MRKLTVFLLLLASAFLLGVVIANEATPEPPSFYWPTQETDSQSTGPLITGVDILGLLEQALPDYRLKTKPSLGVSPAGVNYILCKPEPGGAKSLTMSIRLGVLESVNVASSVVKKSLEYVSIGMIPMPGQIGNESYTPPHLCLTQKRTESDHLCCLEEATLSSPYMHLMNYLNLHSWLARLTMR